MFHHSDIQDLSKYLLGHMLSENLSIINSVNHGYNTVLCTCIKVSEYNSENNKYLQLKYIRTRN